MVYAYLNLVFLLLVGTALLLYTKQRPQRIIWYTLLILLLMTLAFDSLIIILGIVAYSPENIMGVYLWKAPIEDFAYTIASVAIVAMLWEHFEREGHFDGKK